MQPMSRINTTTKYQFFGRPRKTLVQPHTNWTGEIVLPMQVPANLLTGSVYLSDFGISIRAGTQVECKQQTPSCWCAPERFHNVNPTAASDMWSFMCIFAKLYLGALPWSPYGEPLAEMVKIFGSLPQCWKGYFYYPQRANSSWYDPKITPETSLDALITRARPDVDSTERSYVAHVLRRGFAYEPDERITARQLLQDAYFQNILRRYVN
jgi:serine/threonine protein kinase